MFNAILLKTFDGRLMSRVLMIVGNGKKVAGTMVTAGLSGTISRGVLTALLCFRLVRCRLKITTEFGILAITANAAILHILSG